jgi:hypothetical protein
MDAHRSIVVRYRGSVGLCLGALVVLSAAFSPGVVDDLNGGELVAEVQAGTTLGATRGDPGNVTVRWTSNQNAGNLTVWVEGPADVAGPTNTSRVLLEDVGEVVVFRERGAAERNRTVTVLAVATAPDGDREAILKREVEL